MSFPALQSSTKPQLPREGLLLFVLVLVFTGLGIAATQPWSLVVIIATVALLVLAHAAMTNTWHRVVFLSVAVAAATSGVHGSFIYLPLLALGVGLVIQRHRRPSGDGETPIGAKWAAALGWLLAIDTLATAATSNSPSLPVLASVLVVISVSVICWKYFRTVPAEQVRTGVLVMGVTVAMPFIVFVTPRIEGVSGSWTSSYEGSTWVNPNTLGLFFLLCLAVSLTLLSSGDRRVLTITSAVVLTVALGLSFSRSAYLALLVMVVSLLLQRTAKVAVVTAVMSLALLKAPHAVIDRISYTTSSGQLDYSSLIRLDVWRVAWRVALEHPFQGVGLQSLAQDLGPEASYQGLVYAHNSYLTIAAGAGIVLAVLALTGVGVLLRSLVQRVRKDNDPTQARCALLALLATLVCSVFGEPLMNPVILIPLLALIAPVFATREAV